MSTFYESPNDYRNYLCHYGVKGMKWRNHRRSQMQKNFQLPPDGDSVREDNRRIRRNPGHTLSERMHDVESTRHTDGHRTGDQAREDNRRTRRSRRTHPARWEETHQATPGNMPSVIGHIPRALHKPENINNAINYLNNDNTISRKKKRK